MNKELFDKIMQEDRAVRDDLAACVELVMGQVSELEQISALITLLAGKVQYSKKPHEYAKIIVANFINVDWDWRPPGVN